MRSASYSTFGKPAEVLSLQDSALPEPGPGQIRVKMRLASIHNHDLLTVSGEYGVKPPLPAVAGTEAMGVVDAVGEGVTHLQPGQRVAASGQGTWAEYYLASAASAVPLPDTIDDETASQLISMPLSAVALLDFVEAGSGDWIVQNAANGAVGKALAMFAKRRGVQVVNLVRRENAVAELAELGIANAVSTDHPDWRSQVEKITGGAPIKAAIDGVGGKSSGELLSLLAEKGVLVSFGLMSGEPMQLSAGDMIFKEAVAKGFWLSKIAPALPADKMKSLIGEILEGVASGDVRLAVSAVFPLDQIDKAVAAAGEHHRKGKVLVRA
jgi:NADPH:quinone reductase-like Zn-dependent oxidoreductase